MSGGRLRFSLELERHSGSIAGRLSAEQGQTITFIGWLELITALEQARAGATETRVTEDQAPGRRTLRPPPGRADQKTW